MGGGAPQIKLGMRSQCQELCSKKHATDAIQVLESWHTVTWRQSFQMQGKKAWNANRLTFLAADVTAAFVVRTSQFKLHVACTLSSFL